MNALNPNALIFGTVFSIIVAFTIRFIIYPILKLKEFRKLGINPSTLEIIKDAYYYPLGLLCDAAALLNEYEIQFTYEDLKQIHIISRRKYKELIRHAVIKIKVDKSIDNLATAIFDYEKNAA